MRQRQLSLWPGFKCRPHRRVKAARPVPAITRLKNVLASRTRGDGCVQIGVKVLARYVASAERHVKRLLGSLVKEGWMRVVGAAKRGVARTYEVVDRVRKYVPKVLATGVSKMPEKPAAIGVTNGVTSCIPPHPPCIYIPQTPTNTITQGEPEIVVFESAQTVKKSTGLELPAALKLVRNFGTAAVKKALSLLNAERNVVCRPAWFTAALKFQYRHRLDRGPIAVDPAELERRREKARAIDAGLKADEEQRLAKMRAAIAAAPPPTIPLADVISGRFAFLRRSLPASQRAITSNRAKLLQQFDALAKGAM